MTLYKYNVKIRQLNTEDPTNEEIYKLLHDLIIEIIRLKKYKISSDDADAVAYTLAGDIWMKIINGSYFKFVNNYIDKVLLRYILEHIGTYRTKEVFDAVEYQQIVDTFIDESSEVHFGDVENEDYLENAHTVIDYLMERSPYYPGTCKYINFKLSLVASLYSGKFICYNINEFDKEKVRMFIINFNEKIKSDLL